MSRFFWFANVLFRLSCNSPSGQSALGAPAQFTANLLRIGNNLLKTTCFRRAGQLARAQLPIQERLSVGGQDFALVRAELCQKSIGRGMRK